MKKLVMPCVAIGILLLASCASKPGEPGPNADGPTSGQGVYNAGGQVFAQSRGLEVVAPNGQRVASFQGSYALVIGESNYTAGSGWARLDGVREDTAAVRTLFEQQGFSVRVMENMNSKALKDGIESFFHDYGYEENNRLIVYYAGHGHTLSLGQNRDMGYIVPVDAPNPATERVKFMQLAVPMSWFDTWAKQLVSRHALFMFDSCFAGSVFATTRASPGIIDYKIANPVRQFITSGGANETVSDQSIFRRQLERGLREGAADLNHDGYVSGSELGDFLQSTVVNYSYNAQHPQYGKVRDPALDQGDFVFAVRLASTPTPSPSPSPSPAVSTGSVQVTSAVAGSIVIDGTDTGVRIKADGTATVSGVSTGQTEVGVKSSDGRITKAAQTVLVRAGQTVGAVIAMPAPVLTAPRNVRAGTPGTDSVSLTWDSAGSGVSYKVYYGTQNDASRASVLNNVTTGTSMNVSGMASASTYYFWVTAVQNGQESGKSPVLTIRTAAVPVQPNIPADMVRIPAGTFTMGSPSSEAERERNEVQHSVSISKAFFMSKYEVTQREWVDVMGSNPSDFKGDNLPVEQVSWLDVIDYCNKRSVKEGLTPAYTRNGNTVTWNKNANGYRLPTEAEWEYACRAGTTTPYSSGSSVDNAGWYSSNSGWKTHPVGTKQANAWGLYDMHGNVGEWCWDRDGGYSSDSQTDPMGAASGSIRVWRGGSWRYHAAYLRSAARNNYTPTTRYIDLGFRVVHP